MDMYVCVYICDYMYMCMYVYVHMYLYLYMYVCVFMYICMCMHVCKQKGTDCPHPTPVNEAHMYLLHGHLSCGKRSAHNATRYVHAWGPM